MNNNTDNSHIQFTPPITHCSCSKVFEIQSIFIHEYFDIQFEVVKHSAIRYEKKFENHKMCEFFQELFNISCKYIPFYHDDASKWWTETSDPSIKSLFIEREIDTISLQKCKSLETAYLEYVGNFLKVKFEGRFNAKLNENTLKYDIESISLRCYGLKKIY